MEIFESFRICYYVLQGRVASFDLLSVQLRFTLRTVTIGLIQMVSLNPNMNLIITGTTEIDMDSVNDTNIDTNLYMKMSWTQ
jgi:hypothetical protein